MDTTIDRAIDIPEVWSGPSEYHNAVVYAGRNGEGSDGAYRKALEGLKHYPYDVDLLADAIQHAPMGSPEQWLFGGGLDAFDQFKAKELLRERHEDIVFAEDLCVAAFVHYDQWNWRMFCFVIDYLKDRRVTVLFDSQDIERTLLKAVSLSEEFTKRFPNDDRAYNELAESYIACGKPEKAEEMLRDVIFNPEKKRLLLPQCCITLVDLLIDEGDMENALKVARRGQIDTAQTQPSASIGYFAYCEALIMDFELMEKHFSNDPSDPSECFLKDEAEAICKKYAAARDLVQDRPRYLDTINKRTTLLASTFGLKIATSNELPFRLGDSDSRGFKAALNAIQ